MKRAQKHLVRIATVAAGLLPALTLAHPGHGQGHGNASSFVAEALHALGSVDHLLWLAGGLLLSAGLVAASVAATRYFVRSSTAAEPRSPT